MLDANMEALGDDAVSNALVADNADGVLVDVEHSAGLAVVELVGHATLDGTVSQDVDVVALFVRDEVLAEGRHAVLSECAREEISRAGSETEAVGHLSFKPSKYLITKSVNWTILKDITDRA